MSAETDAAIIQRIQNGEGAAFSELYDTYIKKIYDFIYYKVSHRETAEDLTSKTFMKAWRTIDRFDRDAGTFQAWIYQIARNTVIDFYRTQKTTEELDLASGVALENTLEGSIDSKEQLSQIKAFIKTLKPEHREIITMRLWSQLSYQEISEVTGKSAASCKMVVCRVMKNIRQEFAEFMLLILLSFGIIY